MTLIELTAEDFTQQEPSHDFLVIAEYKNEHLVDWCLDWRHVEEIIEYWASIYYGDEDFNPNDIQIVVVEDFITSDTISRVYNLAEEKYRSSRELYFKELEERDKQKRYREYLELKKEFEGEE